MNVERCIFHIFLHICFFSCQNIYKENLPEVKINNFVIGGFIFNIDWMAKKQLNVNSINHIYKQ